MDREAVLVLHSLAIGGAERHASMIANYLAEHGVSVYIVLLDNAEICYELDPSIKVYSFNCTDSNNFGRCSQIEICSLRKHGFIDKLKIKSSRFLGKDKLAVAETECYLKYNYALTLKNFFNNHPQATIISFMHNPTIASLIALKKLKNKFVFFEFTDPSVNYSDIGLCGVMKKFISRANSGIFQTQDEVDFYEFSDSLKKFIIPNPLDCRGFPEPCMTERKKKIVNFCRITVEKNLPLLIDAFELLHKEYPEYSIEIYGDGNIKNSIIEYIKSKNLHNYISVLPARNDVLSCVNDVAMFVSTSNREGISNSMLEAMAIGLPCICTDCPAGGAKMMIDDHENGLLIPMNDVNALYLAMKELIENPELAEKISANCIDIREKLRPDKICSQIMDVVLD